MENVKDSVYNFILEYNKLMSARELAWGELPQDTESEFVGKLNDLWWNLTEEEQDQIENFFKVENKNEKA